MHFAFNAFGRTLLVALFTLTTACATTSPRNVKSLTDDEAAYLTHPEEIELMAESDRLHKELVRKGLIYRNNDISRYIDSLADRIQSEKIKQKIDLHFYVMRDPSINAFALPNGNIYLNIGLVNKLKTEAQLAFVMAHEAAHVVERHSFKSTLNRQSSVVSAHVADFFLGGLGLSYIAAISSMAEYSRDMETQADEMALSFLSSTEYNLDSAIQSFTQLKEVKHTKASSSLWASHPEAEARILHAYEFAKQHALNLDHALITTAEFDGLKHQLTEATVKMRLRQRQYQLAEEVCQASINANGESSLLLAYIAETYRLRAKNPRAAAKEYAWLYDKKLKDAELITNNKIDEYRETSSEFYQQALALNATELKALRGYGLALIEWGNVDEGREYLNQYLNHPSISDRRYIESVLQEI